MQDKAISSQSQIWMNFKGTTKVGISGGYSGSFM